MKRYQKILLEQEEDAEPAAEDSEGPRETRTVDMDIFAREVARLINNYENLLDMESIILNHAKRYIVTNYGEEMLTSFEDMIANRYDIEFGLDSYETPADEQGVGLLEPVAVGATGGEGGGAM